MRSAVCLILSIVLLAAVACRPPAVETGQKPASAIDTVRTFEVRGVVVGRGPGEREVVIKHEAIPGYMDAMTMPLEVKDVGELEGVEPGDVVTFRMLVSATEGWIDSVREVGHDPTVAPEVRKGPRVVPLVDPLAVGDRVPDYVLTNQLGAAVRLSDFRGQALGLTFFFTRCPYPNFCPRMSSNFAAAAAALGAAGSGVTNWHLLSLSFDPDNDTPAVLKAYGEGYGQDPARWTLATADMPTIDALTEQFGLMFAREGESFGHNSRTAVIDPGGRVFRIIGGNTWAVDDFVESMRAAAKGEAPASSGPGE